MTLEPASITQITHVAKDAAAVVLNSFKDGFLGWVLLWEDSLTGKGQPCSDSAGRFSPARLSESF